jgi:hypothetical protein
MGGPAETYDGDGAAFGGQVRFRPLGQNLKLSFVKIRPL